MALPSGQDQRSLERESRKAGSHVQRNILLGEWKLLDIWGRTNREPSSLSREILRALRAALQNSASGHQDLELINSVELLGIKIGFRGPGRLVRLTALLCFRFHRLKVQVAGRTVFSIPLPQPTTP